MKLLKIYTVLLTISLCSCTGMRSLSVPILKQSKIIQSTNEEQQIVKPQPEISKPSKPVAKQNKINKSTGGKNMLVSSITPAGKND